MEENKETEKLSYEQLEQIATKLSIQNGELRKALQETAGVTKRLDYLFKTLDLAHLFSAEFVDKCVAEVEGYMTLPETEETSNETKEVNV